MPGQLAPALLERDVGNPCAYFARQGGEPQPAANRGRPVAALPGCRAL